MNTLTEILLILVVTVLTITLTIIGVQIFLILKDLRERISKVDPILENLVLEQEYLNEILVSTKATTKRVSETSEYLTEEVIKPIGDVLSAVKTVSRFIGQFRQRPSKKEYLRDEHEEEMEE